MESKADKARIAKAKGEEIEDTEDTKREEERNSEN